MDLTEEIFQDLKGLLLKVHLHRGKEDSGYPNLMLDRPEWGQELGPHGVQKVFPPAPLQRAQPLAAPLDVVLHYNLSVRTVVLVRYPKICTYIF